MEMISQPRFDEIITRLYHAYHVAGHPDFKAIWLAKAREIQRLELAKMRIHQQEGIYK